MIEFILPFISGACLSAAATLILTRKLNVSGDTLRQILNVLTTLYEHLTDDGRLDEAEQAEFREQVRQLIVLLKNNLKETT